MNISGIRPRPGFYESWPGYFNAENKEKDGFDSVEEFNTARIRLLRKEGL